jgi:CIC family chloride channel protein
VAFLVQNWAPEAKGHGVPEVVDAIHYKEGKIRPSVAGVKIIASSFSIGSGGSVGREGPIIQIGSTFGSIVGVLSGCSVAQRVVLIACGAAGGIAATFNTPIGGIVFAMELMLPASNSRTLMPLGVTSVVATYIGRATLGLHPAFDIEPLQAPQVSVESALALITFVPFGIIVGLVSVIFVKGIYWSEDFFEAMPGTYYSRHSLGMLGQGLLMFLMIKFTGHRDAEGVDQLGHYYVQGVGYATVRDILSWESANHTAAPGNHSHGLPVHNGTHPHHGEAIPESISNPTFCLLLFLAKFLSTNITIGSGASGGIFSPSLYVGVTLGGVWGHIISSTNDMSTAPSYLRAATAFDPVQACVAGMAGMVGGSTGASITAIVMTFEMTRDYATILPIIITTVMAHMTRKAISEDSIYTLKLVRRGHVVPEGLQAAVHAAQRVRDVMSTNFRILSSRDMMSGYDGVTLMLEDELARGVSINGSEQPVLAPLHAPSLDQQLGDTEAVMAPGAAPEGRALSCAIGPVVLDTQQLFGRALTVEEYAEATGDATRKLCIVQPESDLPESIRMMTALGANALVVSTDPSSGLSSDVVGIVTRVDICNQISAKSRLMARDRTLRLSIFRN